MAGTPVSGSPSPAEQAQAWNDAIFSWYFGTHMAHRPVYLSFDDAAAKSIAAERGWHGATAKELAACLRPWLETSQPFSYWTWRADSWLSHRGSTPPPFLHLLALTVLPNTLPKSASTEAGYYPPLFDVLGIKDTAERRADYRQQVPGLWMRLAKWLRSAEGRCGLPTASAGTGAFAYLGYSRSQALLRTVDRAAFIDFFEQVGYLPGDEPPHALLLARFERWATRASVSARIREALGDKDRRIALASAIASDLKVWTGESRDDDFRCTLRVVPRLNAAKRSLTAVLICPPAFGGIHDGTTEIAPSGKERVFLNWEIALRGESKREHFTVGGERLQLRHRLVHAFEEDPILGGYTAIDRTTDGRSAWLAIAASAGDAIAYVKSQGANTTTWPSLPGWTIVRDVRFTVQDATRAPQSLLDILPPLGMRASLSGGLHLGSSRYLTGGAPDLLVPASPLPLAASLNGQPVATIAADTPALITLASRATAPGSYVVEVGDQQLRFAVEQPGRPELREGVLSHVLQRNPVILFGLDVGATVGPGEVGVSGAAIDCPATDAADEVSWPPATDGWIAIAPTGEATYLPAVPEWMAQIGQGACYLTRTDLLSSVPHPVAWVVRLMRTKVHLRALDSTDSGPEQLVEPIPALGDRTILVAASQVGSWREHVAVHGSPQATIPRRPTTSFASSGEYPHLDQILTWCSERTTGTITDFVRTYRWATGDGEPGTAYRALRVLNRLGHIEIDWHQSRRWTTTPTRIVAPAGAAGLAFIVGRRPLALPAHVERSVEDHDLDAVVMTAAPPTPGASLLLVRAGSRNELLRVASAAGLECIADAATHLARLLPTLDRMLRVGTIATGFERRKIIVSARGYTLEAADGDGWRGSYEHDSYGPKIYSFRDDSVDKQTYLVDRSTALWLELRRKKLCPIGYDAPTLTLRVPAGLGLPLLHDRALVLSTGCLPAYEWGQQHAQLVYHNIAPVIAQRVKDALSQ